VKEACRIFPLPPVNFLDKAETRWYPVVTKHGFFPVVRGFHEWYFTEKRIARGGGGWRSAVDPQSLLFME
jgi:hypothetical protein